MSRFKIIVFLMAVGFLAGIFSVAWYFYVNVISPEADVQTGITAMGKKGAPPPDPGIKRFERAMELVDANDLSGGRAALYDLLRTFPTSSRVPEAKRIIGEINMDGLFNADLNPQGKDYIVQPGDAPLSIAGRQQTTIECLMRANGLQSGLLQPGDHLFVFPLDFAIVVDVSSKTVTLMRNGYFFREYAALDIKLPSGTRLPFEAKVVDKPAWVGGRRAPPFSADFLTADKWLIAEKLKGDKTTFNIRGFPKARPVDPTATAAGPKSKGKGKSTRKGEALAGTAVDDDDVDVTSTVPLTGVFLPSEDIEELFTIIRTKTPLTVIQ
jgi:hypothetical protein